VTAERLLALLGLALALALLSRFGPPAWRSWQVYAGTRTRRLADAGPLAIPPPDAVATRLEELGALGFVRLGERSLRLPQGLRFEWNVRDETGGTYVAVVPLTRGALVAFYSSFEDGTWVVTAFPRGEVVRRANFFSSFVGSSVADALTSHRKQVDELRPGHGRLRPVMTIADSLRMDADYRSRFGGVTLRRITVSNMTPGLTALAIAVICVLILLVSR
jgi:hypothetical protein